MRLLACLLLVFAAPLGAEVSADWTTSVAPFRIADDVFYVGSRDLASFLITTPAGNMLINANLETSPAQIRASVEKLGFRWADMKILLNSQAHFDHVAGAARVLAETHARDLVMDEDVPAMKTGGKADFAFGDDITTGYMPARVDEVLHDGSAVTLGGVTLIAHKTAGHTRGCTTFTLRAHLPGEPAGTLRDLVIVGGVAPLPHYRLVGRESYPGISADFEHTFLTLRGLPCDVFLGAHGAYFGMLGKLARMPAEGAEVWVDPAGYRQFVSKSELSFEKMLAEQRARP